MSLKDDMARLEQRVQELLKAPENDVYKDKHHEVCCEVADAFDLWELPPECDADDTLDDGVESFPVWLSRVVEGVMRDVEECRA